MLSKSDFLLYLKHPAWVWLKKHDKEKLPPVDEAMQAIFDEGSLLESYAEQLFPDAIRLGWEDYQDYRMLPERTGQALADGADVIIQGRFATEEITCIVDVLERTQNGAFNLYEIKGSTKVKSEHIADLSFQKTVLERCGYTIDRLFVLHVDNTYVRAGDIDVQDLTITANVTEDVTRRHSQVKEQIEDALAVLADNKMPDPSPRYVNGDKNVFKEWLAVYERLDGEIEPESIYTLAGINPSLVGTLEDAGLRYIRDIPDSLLTKKKALQHARLVQSGEPSVNAEEIRKFLETFEYPLYFLDYETYGSVIPPFDGMRPYQQVPFQYSLHRLDAPDVETVHTEYLHADASHPVKELAEQLLQDISDRGSVVVWNEGFEKGCNETMAAMCPEMADSLFAINERIVDLMTPFSKGWYQHKDFAGSASIKAVLPVLAPELNYKELEVSDGSAAQRTWAQTVLQGKNTDQKDEIMDQLREYCKLDTWGMVRIWQELNRI